jgi:hypothetical protein
LNAGQNTLPPCEYLEESLGGAGLYPVDALSRARQRGWIEFGTATLADAWQFLTATDRPTSDTKQAAFRDRLQRLEAVLAAGPYFGGAAFGMVDAVFAPLFRYFDILDPTVSDGDGVTRPRAQSGRLRSTVSDFPDEADVEVITPRDDAIAVQLKDAHHLRRSDLAAVSALEAIQSFGKHAVPPLGFYLVYLLIFRYFLAKLTSK